jgi:hypothetical protein
VQPTTWPHDCPPCWIAEIGAVPSETHAYYEPSPRGGFVLRDMLDHITSVKTPVVLRPVYEIRQFSHRRASFLKRHLVPLAVRASLPHYPARLEAYKMWPTADALHADLLYDPSGALIAEFQDLWGIPDNPAKVGRVAAADAHSPA